MDIRIKHAHDTGTVIRGTTRGDTASLVITSVRDGWRYSRDRGAWTLPHTTGSPPDRARIERVAEALHAAGFTVDIRIQDGSAPRAGTGQPRLAGCRPACQRSFRRAARRRAASGAPSGEDRP